MSKILWLAIDRSARVARHFDTLRDAVVKETKVFTHFKKLPMTAGQYSKLTTSNKLVEPMVLDFLLNINQYDIIVCDALFAYMNEDWSNIDIPVFMILEDLHGPVIEKQVELAKKHNFIILHRYNNSLDVFHPGLRETNKCIWLPHAVDSIFKNYSKKNKDVVFTGATISTHYPLRWKIVQELKRKSYFHYYNRSQETLEKIYKYPQGLEYAKLISSAKISIATGATVNYPVMKFMEIPACGTLLLSNWFNELSDLGFEPNKNIVVLNENNISKQIESLLKNNDKIERISIEGQKLIKERHTVEIRAKEFIEHVKEIC